MGSVEVSVMIFEWPWKARLASRSGGLYGGLRAMVALLVVLALFLRPMFIGCVSDEIKLACLGRGSSDGKEVLELRKKMMRKK